MFSKVGLCLLGCFVVWLFIWLVDHFLLLMGSIFVLEVGFVIAAVSTVVSPMLNIKFGAL